MSYRFILLPEEVSNKLWKGDKGILLIKDFVNDWGAMIVISSPLSAKTRQNWSTKTKSIVLDVGYPGETTQICIFWFFW